ncbi:Rieske (2Fe-2S) protein [Oceanimonas sp. MB9]|uniref:Rieske (2Fe-2S) protein n=1 Tax=Oceanimonas sp. MB9 TaxID=2588453 RepID=UPI0013F5AC71|nr:Rieske (2Fe-2S) protein [Oceanimonas sp. MB9]NHI01834.1 3-phenylpropionate/cinnamic acid dioxygenase ferredoxin subunit [Oceanimonas sp. MB9]
MSKKKYTVCKVDEVRPGQQKIVQLDKFSVGVFNIGGEYHALLNVCPHRGAALCEGPVCGTTQPTDQREFIYCQENALVRCAWHGWEFDIKSGEFLVDPSIKAKTFPVSVEADEVFVHI